MQNNSEKLDLLPAKLAAQIENSKKCLCCYGYQKNKIQILRIIALKLTLCINKSCEVSQRFLLNHKNMLKGSL